MDVNEASIQVIKHRARNNPLGVWSNGHVLSIIDYFEKKLRQKKVTLPAKVAEAIESFREDLWANREIITNALSKSYNTTERSIIIRSYASDHLEDFISALFFGYTVEKSENERVREIRQEIRRWYKGALIRIKDGTDKDEFAKEAIEEVVHYLGGDEILADISKFNAIQLSKQPKQQ